MLQVRDEQDDMIRPLRIVKWINTIMNFHQSLPDTKPDVAWIMSVIIMGEGGGFMHHQGIVGIDITGIKEAVTVVLTNFVNALLVFM